MNAVMSAKSSKSNGHTNSTQNSGQQQSGQWQPNIGKIDRYIRLASGLFFIGSSVSNRNSSVASRALLALGAMKVTEGILGWCPMMELFGVKDTSGVIESQTSNSDQQSQMSHSKNNAGSHERTRESQGTQDKQKDHQEHNNHSAHHREDHHDAPRNHDSERESTHRRNDDGNKRQFDAEHHQHQEHQHQEHQHQEHQHQEHQHQEHQHKEPSGHQGPEQSWNQMADSRDKSERDEVVAAMNTSFQ